MRASLFEGEYPGGLEQSPKRSSAPDVLARAVLLVPHPQWRRRSALRRLLGANSMWLKQGGRISVTSSRWRSARRSDSPSEASRLPGPSEAPFAASRGAREARRRPGRIDAGRRENPHSSSGGSSMIPSAHFAQTSAALSCASAASRPMSFIRPALRSRASTGGPRPTGSTLRCSCASSSAGSAASASTAAWWRFQRSSRRTRSGRAASARASSARRPGSSTV